MNSLYAPSHSDCKPAIAQLSPHRLLLLLLLCCCWLRQPLLADLLPTALRVVALA
jgi:hypothetical protein